MLKPFTLDQLVEVSEILDSSNGGKIGFKSAVAILKIALSNADPPIENPGAVTIDFKDVGAANTAILRLSGIEVKPATDPQQADAPAA